jgi:hypothetical protein
MCTYYTHTYIFPNGVPLQPACPEEGQPNNQGTDTGHTGQIEGNRLADEKVVLLPELGIHGEGPTYRGLTIATGFACGGSIKEEEEEPAPYVHTRNVPLLTLKQNATSST